MVLLVKLEPIGSTGLPRCTCNHIKYFAVALIDQQCANRVATGAAVGGALGASIGVLECFTFIVSCEVFVDIVHLNKL